MIDFNEFTHALNLVGLGDFLSKNKLDQFIRSWNEDLSTGLMCERNIFHLNFEEKN